MGREGPKVPRLDERACGPRVKAESVGAFWFYNLKTMFLASKQSTRDTLLFLYRFYLLVHSVFLDYYCPPIYADGHRLFTHDSRV